MNGDLVAISDLEKMANAFAKSNFFGMKTPDQAMALMLIAQAEGKHPATAAQEYHVIQGKPALKADAMLARFQKAGGKVSWSDYEDTKVTGVFSHPQGGSVTVSWTIDMAKRIGLASKDNWKNYPRAQLRARCISEGVRTVYPGIAVGVYTPEEVEDFDTSRPMVDITPSDTDHSKPRSPFKNAAGRNLFCKNVKDSFASAKTHAELTDLMEANKTRFSEMEISGAEADQLGREDLRQAYKTFWNRLSIATREISEEDNSEFDENDRIHEEEIASGLAAKPGISY